MTPSGETIVAATEMFRSMPHDIANALAASATALAGGASLSGVRAALREVTGLSHRVELVAESNGVTWYDDSKATAPHAVIAAVSPTQDPGLGPIDETGGGIPARIGGIEP